MGKFVIRTVPTGVKFDLKAPNGETILTSEVYLTLAACRSGIASVRKNVPAAGTEDHTGGSPVTLPNPKFELYRDKAGAFRFRLKARNGKIIAVSEAYAALGGCLNGIASVRKNSAAAEIVVEGKL